MREILLDELKDRQIAILDVVDAFCRENNINYWLDSGTLLGAISVADKELIVKQFVQPMVAIGDGDNDSGMARLSEVAIGFGGVREIAPSLFRNINFAFYDDRRCAEFLWDLL